tara:strand:+ start:99 stop:281 length:183 start_codon:yes stop_codon:yes gene_type:complete
MFFFWALPQGSGFRTRLPQKSGRAQTIAQSLTRIGVLKKKVIYKYMQALKFLKFKASSFF